MIIRKIKLFILDTAYRIAHINFGKNSIYMPDTLTLFFYSKRHHPGLADQLKAIVNGYYISSLNGFKFRIIHNDPFPLTRYLEPAEYDWRSNENQLGNSLRHIRMLDLFRDIDMTLKRGEEYQCILYEGYPIKKLLDEPVLFHDLFNTLFKPSCSLMHELEKIPMYGKNYIAVHLRFVNAFELQETRYPTRPLSQAKQEKLIRNCLHFIDSVNHKHNMPVILFSDSNFFIGIARENKIHIVEEGGIIGHCTEVNDERVIMKTFVDFYMIAGARYVYTAYSKELYASAFSYYAAMAGGVPFEQCVLEDIG